jgi:Ca2+-binding EF-hand superfamily protein
MLAKTNKVL